MRHCCSFKADDIYFLNDNELYSSRKLSIGFCPICSKPVAELIQWRFDGKYEKINLDNIVLCYKTIIRRFIRVLFYT